MVLRKVSVCVLVLAAFAALSAKFCMAAPVKLPKPEPVYFPLLTGLHGKSAILARMDLAVNPKGTTAEQVLAAYVGVRNGTAHPRWITAQVCHLVRVGSGAAAKPLFARTPTAVEFWREQFSGPASLMGSLLSRGGNASFRFPWELRAGPLAGCGWLLVPQPGGGVAWEGCWGHSCRILHLGVQSRVLFVSYFGATGADFAFWVTTIFRVTIRFGLYVSASLLLVPATPFRACVPPS